MTMDPRISIIIVNWNTSKLLEDCLSSIYSETDSSIYEIIVIDNASQDESCTMVESKFPLVKLIKNSSNVGFAAANNQGFAIARGEFILMLNSDTVIKNRAIEKTLEFAIVNPKAGIIGCRLYYPDGTFQNSCFRYPNFLSILFDGLYLSQFFKGSSVFNWDRYGNKDEFWTLPREVECVMGAFMFIRHSVFREVGYLDTDYFMYCEEADFAYRVKRAGYTIIYLPNTSIIHVSGGSQKSFADLAWSYKAIHRAIFFFLYKWKPVTAYFCNIVFVFCLLIRICVWCIHDSITSIREKSFKKRHLLKASTFLFHLKAMIWPDMLHEKWGKDL